MAKIRLSDHNPTADSDVDVEKSVRIRELVRERLGDPLARESGVLESFRRSNAGSKP